MPGVQRRLTPIGRLALTTVLGTGLPCFYDAAVAQQSFQATPPPTATPPQRSPVATLPLPIVYEGRVVGTARATVSLTDVVAVSGGDLAKALEPSVSADVIDALKALGDAPAPAADIRATGVVVNLDTATISLAVSVPTSLRGPQVFSGLGRVNLDGLERVDPSKFAFGLTGALITSSRLDQDVDPNASLGVTGFMNLGGVRGFNLTFAGEANLRGDGQRFRRDRIVGFVDRPEKALRFSAGDLFPALPRLAGQVELLGASFERSYQTLQPLENVRPSGRRAFVLDRRARIEVYANGALVQSFEAQPGPIDIRDIPATALSNDISIVVEDDFGRRELDNFSLGSDIFLLAPGVSEFNVSGGLLRDIEANGIGYTSDPVVNGSYTRGISDTLTLGGHVVLTEKIQNAGASAAIATVGGIAQIETGVSNSDSRGAGVAIGLAYRGDPFRLTQRGGFLNLTADYQSRNYRTFSTLGIRDDIKFELRADYQLRINDRFAANAGASYFERYGPGGADKGVFAGLSTTFDRFTVNVTGRYATRGDGRKQVGAFITAFLPLGRRTVSVASYDTIDNVARAEVRRQPSLTLPDYEYFVRAERNRNVTDLTSRLGFLNSRFASSIDLSQRFARQSANDPLRGTLRLQSGIAFVDGQLGIGRDPSQGFIMVRRHPSLKPGQIEIASGAAGRELGTANGLGPAVIPNFAPFRPQELRVNARNAPTGYDIGPGDYVVISGARTGTSITIGSDAYRSIVGTLRRADGSPIALTTGRITSDTGGEPKTFFTNREGRVFVGNLSPGRYRIEIDGTFLTGEFAVGEKDAAIRDIGVIQLEQTQ